jgi:acetoin utilization deacetylase AcuC-like enzyme/GNAT superfamily N-acetyltransferase
MFRMRRIYDTVLPRNKTALAQVQSILSMQFPLIPSAEIAALPEKLQNPLKHRFRSILFVAEDTHDQIKGFAFLFHEPELQFCYLDFLCTTKKLMGRGIGGALYARVRQEALELKSLGIFFECLPDDPLLCADRETLKANSSRLKFYEFFGARPIIGTAYETPLRVGDDNPPFLIYDDLGRDMPLARARARKIVRAILERKYGALCSPQYTNMVVESFRDDPVRLRDYLYSKGRQQLSVSQAAIPADQQICLVVNSNHEIHHVHERGYVESPVRIKTILKEILPTGLFDPVPAKHFSDQHIRAVHDYQFVEYLKKVCTSIPQNRSIYPYVFPIRNVARPPKELPIRAGYYCIDTFTPLNINAYLAAKGAVDCTMTAAREILDGRRLVYALVRPPGHHAERRSFGGFCYLNSTAIAAHHLSAYGKVAILDVDYHHGNGQQDIFSDRPDVLTISIHGHPHFAYPYFSGFRDETGVGAGKGFNYNFPLPERMDGNGYRETLQQALTRIHRFSPDFLVVALGLDTAKGDPTGTWELRAQDFQENGRLVGELRLPTLVVQEGGYNHRNLGINANRFFKGLWSAHRT